ncbi:MAG TPA: SIS domain-containing protein [Streptosporangiaceae bacterium]|jgi:glucose/mannose-6-phosphate isomerase
MAAMAAALLDDAAGIEAADPGGILRQVASSAAQVRSSLTATQETDLSELVAAGRPRAIVVAGMGGSGIAGDVLAAICGPGCPVQIVPVHGYQLPGWVSAADLVIAVSCSGTTEETLAAAEEAVRRGCRLLGVGGAGSPLAGLAEQARAPFIPVRSAGMPRSTLWGLSIPLAGVAARLGLCEATVEAHEAAATMLEDFSQRCRPDSDAFVNPAKGIALDLAGTLPMIWGTSPLAGVAAYRFACQLNENAKYPAINGVLPEANHNQVVAFDGPFAPGASLPWVPGAPDDDDAGPAAPLHLIMLADSQEHPQVTKRREASMELARARGIGVTELATQGDHPLVRLASLTQLIDYATVYLGIALGFDPSPITAIQELKARIA